MRIRCLHGYFIFEEREPGEVSQFLSLYGLDLVPIPEGFTFSPLAEAPEHAIAGGLYLGAPVTKTFEGKPWEIMRENELVYSINLGAVVPIASIVSTVTISQAGYYFLAEGLIQPGALTPDGDRVKDFSGFYLFEQARFKYSEVSFE